MSIFLLIAESLGGHAGKQGVAGSIPGGGIHYHFEIFAKAPQTYVATALRPIRDWHFPIAEVATRSPIGPGEVTEKSATSRGPRSDQISRS